MNLSLLMLPGTFVQQNYDQRLQSINQMTFFQKRQFLLLKFYVSDQKAFPVMLVLVSGWCFFFQVLSPLAKGLFHKAISESGTAIRALFTDKPEEEAQVGILWHI